MSTAITKTATRACRRLAAGVHRGAAAGLGLALIGGTVLGATGGAQATAVAAPAPRLAAPAMQPAADALPHAGTTPEAPAVKTTVSVAGKVGAAAPAPPVDAMGTPAASTLVQADDLQVTGITRPAGGGQSVSNAWESIDYGHDHPLSPPESQAGPALVNPNYPTAAGRFLDPNRDRALALRMTATPQGARVAFPGDMLQLGSTDGGTAARSPCPLAVGDTCSFVVRGVGGGGDGGFVTDGDSSRPSGVFFGSLAHPATTQQWTLVGVGNADGFVELMSKSDGLCLSADATVGSVAGPTPCGDATLWKPVTVAPGHVSLLNSDGLELGATAVGAGGAQMVARGADTGYFETEQISEPGGVIPTWSTVLAPLYIQDAAPFALATGDLDRVVGADEAYHDESVVAFADPRTDRLQVRVIDYSANASHLLVTAPDVALPRVGAWRAGGGWYPGSVGVGVGHFAGNDALNQIAVTWQDSTGRFHLTLLAYRATHDGGRTLTVIGDPTGTTLFTEQPATESLASGYAQTVAADLEGGGHADVAIAYAAANPGTTLLSGHLGVVSLTADFHLRGETSVQFTQTSELVNSGKAFGTWTPHGVRLAAGYFRDDPTAGYNFARRELAVTWQEVRPGGVRVAVYDVNPRPDCTPDTCALSVDAQVGPSTYESVASVDLPIPVAAGGFEGVGTGASPPLWDIVLYRADLVNNGGGVSLLRYLTVLRPQPGANAFLDPYSQQLSVPDTTQVVLTAYDRQGASLALGAPLIYTVTNLTRDTLIAAQPPAHSDWLDGRFVNVSRVGDFAVKMGSSQTKEYSHTSTQSASQTNGVTQSADIKASLRTGTKDAGVTRSLEVKEKFAMNWSETSSRFAKYSTTITTTATATGQDDDIVQALIQTQYFYRYPILGQPLKAPDGSLYYPFYQVTVPGQVVPVNGFGRALSFYQPSWQNGDALSYPKLVDGQVAIPDLGPYTYTDDSGSPVKVTAPLLDSVNDVGGGATTDQLKITGKTGAGTTTTSGTKLNASVEVTGTLSAKGDIGVFKGSGSVSLSVGYNGSRATGTGDTSSSTSTSASSFELHIPTINSNEGYRVGTAYYYDTSGMPKVIHGVDLTSDAGSTEFWRRNYGQAPDPALNLPDATFLTYDDHGLLIVPNFSTLATRQLIRGFAALQPYDPSSPMTSGQPYGTDPQVGDPVTFAVQVHNYSLVDSPSVPVNFYAVPVDANGINVTGTPEQIGTVPSGSIPSQAAVTVKTPTWTAKGPATGRDAQNWRIFVILDPDNTLHEIHPWKDGATCPTDALDPNAPAGTVVDGKMVDPMTGQPETLACGQNNQGYGTVTVMPATQTPPNGGGTGLGAPQTTEVRLAGGGLADGTTSALRLGATAGTTSVRLAEDATGIVHTDTPATSTAIESVLIYDGPPSDGRLIAVTTLDGASKAGGGDAEFTWRPSTPGVHTIYEELIGSDPAGNSEQTLRVDVVAPPTVTGPALASWSPATGGSTASKPPRTAH